MQTTLCFDFGNTRLKCAIFVNNEFKEVIVLNDDSVLTVEDIIHQYQPQKSILSSVINHNPEIEVVLEKSTAFHKLGPSSKINFTTPIGKPETIGADRLAICAAAVDLFPNNHVLTIALGTCITFNYTNKLHQFLGGSISPGMYMRFKAMNEQTALLPLVKPTLNFPLVGYDTATNLQSGVILGMAKEIDGIIDLYKEKFDDIQIILTGGDMEFFTPHIRNSLIADPYLLYKGLFAISKAN
ncbi:MAG: type III pantothenate kinase [Bacteroidetes bacterium]|nr:type III pantothenate kinase [Bacteroidota bacterium]